MNIDEDGGLLDISDWLWQQTRGGAVAAATVRRLAQAAGTPEATGVTGTSLPLFAPIVAGTRPSARHPASAPETTHPDPGDDPGDAQGQ